MSNLDFIDTKELAAQLRKPESTVQRWARTKKIPSIRAGWRTRLYDPVSVRAALKRLEVKAR